MKLSRKLKKTKGALNSPTFVKLDKAHNVKLNASVVRNCVLERRPFRYFKHTKWLAGSCILIALSLGSGIQAGPSSQTNFFPIMAWNWVTNDPATLAKIRQAGLTVAGFADPDMLDECQEAGLKVFVSDKRASGYNWRHMNANQARRNVAALLKEVGQKPAVYGYFLQDEPSVHVFSGLSEVTSLFGEQSPGKIPFINLFPNYANSEQLGTTNCSAYLEDFIAACHPALLCYDNYSLMDDGSIRQSYWSNLEAVRNASKRHDLDFWNIILSVAHFNYRVPTAADFRFQVYTTLAYGARGIVYFDYFAPHVGNYRMAPIDQFGHRTATWYFMQNVNLQIQRLAPTLLELTSREVYHFGDIPEDCHGPATNSLVEHLNGGNFLVGDFSGGDGARYVMIVNKDLSQSHPCLPKLRYSGG